MQWPNDTDHKGHRGQTYLVLCPVLLLAALPVALLTLHLPKDQRSGRVAY